LFDPKQLWTMPSNTLSTDWRRVLLAGCLALLVVTAGCNGLLGLGGDDTQTSDSAVDPATVPGVEANGSVDGQRLASAHVDALSNRSFTAEQRVVVRDGSDAVVRESHTVTRIAANRSRYLYADNVTGPNTAYDNDAEARLALFADGERVYRQFRIGGSTDARLVRAADQEPLTPREGLEFQPTLRNRIGFVLSTMESTSVDAREQSVVLSGTFDPTGMSLNDRDLDATGNGTVSVTVGPNGQVTEYEVAYDATLDGESVRVRETAAVFGVGDTAVGQPAWVDDLGTEANATTTAS
jgi:hypothetical protein